MFSFVARRGSHAVFAFGLVFMLIAALAATADAASDWTDVAAGAKYSCGIEAGTVKCWGASVGSLTPVAVTGLSGTATDVSVGGFAACAVSGGAAYCWGYSGGNQDTPGRIIDSGALAVSVGGDHGCAIVDAGSGNHGAVCFGYDDVGQLGNGSTASGGGNFFAVTGLTTGVTAISAGEKHSCAVVSGSVACWGDNRFGQLGNPLVTTAYSASPTAAYQQVGASDVSAGGFHTCDVKSGAVNCWGYNVFGPGSVAVLAGCAPNNTVCQNAATGSASKGSLGTGSTDAVNMAPAAVGGLASNATSISAGGFHDCASLVSGTMRCWGWNASGQLGDGTTSDRATPVEPVGLDSGVGVISSGTGVSGTGNENTCALVSGAPWCWGANDLGQLGDGTQTDSHAPAHVGGPLSTNTGPGSGPVVTPVISAPTLKAGKSLKLGKSLVLSSSCPAGCEVSVTLKIGAKKIKLHTIKIKPGATHVKFKMPSADVRKLRSAFKKNTRTKAVLTFVPKAPSGTGKTLIVRVKA